MSWRVSAGAEVKRRAALAAFQHVEDGMVLGLGTGSTVAEFIKLLGERVREGWKLYGVPSSYQSYLLAIKHGIAIASLDAYPELDLTVDGADEVEPATLTLVKGGGAALAREKVIGMAARRTIIIADYTKLVSRIGEKAPIPVEVLPFARSFVEKKLGELGGQPQLRLAGKVKDGPVVTDNGNFILDVKFPPIENPKELEFKIKELPGVVEVGIFTGIASEAYIAYPDQVKHLTPVKT
ncbi:MAG: ribose-5-phosphate isomerase RpiA [Candidatus Verstraetearchaeota archaeon]|nr:ribose-5-phosphate isomerase RpiA [Candidatus Verstraetearchaeota archaeon]